MKTKAKVKLSHKSLGKPTRHPTYIKHVETPVRELKHLDKMQIEKIFQLDKKYKMSLRTYENRRKAMKEFREGVKKSKSLSVWNTITKWFKF